MDKELRKQIINEVYAWKDKNLPDAYGDSLCDGVMALMEGISFQEQLDNIPNEERLQAIHTFVNTVLNFAHTGNAKGIQ